MKIISLELLWISWNFHSDDVTQIEKLGKGALELYLGIPRGGKNADQNDAVIFK